MKFFDTERQAIAAKRKLKGTKRMRWVVQGNILVKIPRRVAKRNINPKEAESIDRMLSRFKRRLKK